MSQSMFFKAPVTILSLVALLLLPGFLGVGCAGRSITDTSLDEADAAQQAYRRAMKTFDGGNYLEAINQFTALRTRFPYSQVSSDAVVMVADCQFQLGNYAEAAEQYRAFVRFHPNHAKVSYAAFMVGKSFHKQVPRNWFITPPAYEKDQAAARSALRELQVFATHFPHADEIGEAQEMILQLSTLLASHEMYVARFYIKRNRPQAAVRRLQGLVTMYPDIPLASEALALAGSLQLDAGEPERAAATFEDFLRRYPDHQQAESVRRNLEKAEAAKRGVSD